MSKLRMPHRGVLCLEVIIINILFRTTFLQRLAIRIVHFIQPYIYIYIEEYIIILSCQTIHIINFYRVFSGIEMLLSIKV